MKYNYNDFVAIRNVDVRPGHCKKFANKYRKPYKISRGLPNDRYGVTIQSGPRLHSPVLPQQLAQRCLSVGASDQSFFPKGLVFLDFEEWENVYYSPGMV